MAQEVLLIGLGREAKAAAHYFRGRPLFVHDDNPDKAAHFAADHGGTAIDAGAVETHANALILRAPGMAPAHALLSRLSAAGRPLTTYLGHWLAAHRSAVLATITGSKGKSTTTSLTGLILQGAGIDVHVGGNIGVVPTAPPAGERWVFETSSYQLSDIPAAAPVHAMTTLFPEHLDWHGGFDNYLAAKLRPFTLDHACIAVIPRNLERHVAHLINPIRFAEDMVQIGTQAISLAGNGARAAAPLSEALSTRLARDSLLKHNLTVALAAAATACDADPATLAAAAVRAAESWQGLPSRQRLLGEFAGRLWVDDALATIPQATMAALQQWENRRVRLILGGRNREQDFDSMASYVNTRADVAVFAYGDSAKRVAPLLTRATVCANFEETLVAAFAASAPGDVILFSPAGATAEPGATYETRAQRFAEFARSQHES
jgi:UDP-N-acetylmuramoylalanine--D-glutamate ligase